MFKTISLKLASINAFIIKSNWFEILFLLKTDCFQKWHFHGKAGSSRQTNIYLLVRTTNGAFPISISRQHPHAFPSASEICWFHLRQLMTNPTESNRNHSVTRVGNGKHQQVCWHAGLSPTSQISEKNGSNGFWKAGNPAVAILWLHEPNTSLRYLWIATILSTETRQRQKLMNCRRHWSPIVVVLEKLLTTTTSRERWETCGKNFSISRD